jgi:TonB-dependent starch-binding outer membrane protein SusC
MKNHLRTRLTRAMLLGIFACQTLFSWAITPTKTLADINISGIVTASDNNEPLVGASIRIQGTDKGTQTDVDGKFSLTAPADATLLVSFVGYEEQKIAVNNRTSINVILKATGTLNEVVVVGYGQSSRKTLASAVTTMKPEDLNRGAISDVGQLLQGKVPGLNISASGDPNRPAAVILRGASTINSSQGLFYVIDGVPGADISIIAPDDIATIDVLKDAAATSIYGNRAANGVIMVTTKKGKKGQGVVSYSGFVGSETVSSRLEMMNAAELKAFVAANGSAMTPANDKGADTDWQKAVQRSRALSHNHNLSFSGGGDHHSYSASLNFMNKEGIVLESDFERIIGRVQFDQSFLNDKVKLGMQVSNARTKSDYTPQRNSVLGQMITYLPVSPVRNPDGSLFENFTTTGYFNPVSLIEHGQDQTIFNNLIGAFTAQVELPFGLSYNLNLSHQKNTSLHGEFYGSYYSQYNSANFFYKPEPPSVHFLQNFGTNGSAVRNTYENTNNILETFLTWNKDFGNHSLRAVVGYSWQDNKIGDGFQITSTNFPVDNIGFNNFALSNPYAITSYRVNFGADGIFQENRLISDFGRLNYGFKNKYLLQGSIRRDGSSVFGKNNQWGYFPSVAVAWRIMEEGFMKNQTFFDDLKLRASYGVTGNSSGFNAYTALFLSGSLGSFYNNGTLTAALGPTKAANPDLQWEKTATQNLGLDFSILKGKISGTLEVYDKTTTGMIYSYGVDRALVPTGSIVANGGEMNNRGVELSLNFTPLSTKTVNWTSTVNLASNTNKIVSLSNPLFAGGDSVRLTQPEGSGQTGSTLQLLKAGYPLGQFFTFQYAGKDANGVSQYNKKNGELTLTPAIGADYHYAGSPQPKLLLGWNNSLRVSNFDFNFFLRGVFGNKIFNGTRADLFRPTTAQFTNVLKDVASESTKNINSHRYSSRFVEDGSYIRMDNATLGYTITGLSQYMKMLRVYVAVNNAFTWTKYKGIDPEVNQGGIAPGVDTNNFYPKTRTIMVGLNTSF